MGASEDRGWTGLGDGGGRGGWGLKNFQGRGGTKFFSGQIAPLAPPKISNKNKNNNNKKKRGSIIIVVRQQLQVKITK